MLTKISTSLYVYPIDSTNAQPISTYWGIHLTALGSWFDPKCGHATADSKIMLRPWLFFKQILRELLWLRMKATS